MNTWRICFWGDSITHGMNDRGGGGWVHRIRNVCEAQRQDVVVYNLGVSGATSRDLVNRFAVEAAARGPDIVVLNLGTNDSEYEIDAARPEITLEQFKMNTMTLITEAKKWTDHVFIVGPAGVDDSKTMPWQDTFYSNASMQRYHHLLEDVAQAESVTYLSVWQRLSPKNLPDGLHPNGAGHEALYQCIIEQQPIATWLPSISEGQLPSRGERLNGQAL